MRQAEGEEIADLARAQKLGRIVATARSEKSFSQEELARVVGMGTSSLRLLEAGKSLGPSVFTVLNLLRALELEVSVLEGITHDGS